MRDDLNYRLDYEKLIDMFPCALYVMKGAVIIDCNNAAVEMFGYEGKEDIIGQSPYDFSPKFQADGELSVKKGQGIIDYALTSGKEAVFQWTHKRKNGEIFLADIIIHNREGNLYAVMTDIDEIEYLKKQLKDRNHLYRLLFQKHKMVMLIIDPENGFIVDVNKAAIEYYGYDKEDFLRMNIKDINISSHEENKNGILSDKAGEDKHFQYIHRLANGEEREVEVYSACVEMDGQVLLLSEITDIFGKLRRNLMFNSLFLNSPYATLILDKKQRIVDINKSFTELFKYNLDDIKDKSVEQFIFSPKGQGEINKNIESIYKGNIIRQETMRQRKDGKWIHVETLGYPVVDHQSIIGVYLIYKDISKEVEYEKELLMFKEILKNNTEGVVITDTEGQIKWTNTAFETITGYPLKEVKGRPINILKSGIQDDDFYKEMWEQLANGESWSGEIWNKTKKGEIYSEWLTINSLKDSSGKNCQLCWDF